MFGSQGQLQVPLLRDPPEARLAPEPAAGGHAVHGHAAAAGASEAQVGELPQASLRTSRPACAFSLGGTEGGGFWAIDHVLEVDEGQPFTSTRHGVRLAGHLRCRASVMVGEPTQIYLCHAGSTADVRVHSLCVHSVSLDRAVMTCIHRHRTIQNSFTALKTRPAPPVALLPVHLQQALLFVLLAPIFAFCIVP